MKKIISVIMVIVLMLSLTTTSIAYANGGVTVKLNGSTLNFDVPPQIINGRTMVPMRAIFENLGATVEWQQTTQTVISQKGNTVISLTIGVPNIIVNGTAKTLDIAPCIINGRTLVPVRAVSEAFNLNVDWDGNTQTVIINSGASSNSAYAIPYCPGDFSKIGKKFSENYVPGTGLQYSSSSLYILMVQQYALNRQGWDAYTDYNGYGSRIGVAGDRIVFNIQDIADGTLLSEALPSDMLGVKPLITYGYDENGNVREQMLFWKGDNGYMVGFVEAKGYPNGSYLNERVKYFISTVDLNYIYNVPQEVLSSNSAF